MQRENGDARACVLRKQELIRRAPSGPGKREWHQEMAGVNRELNGLVDGDRQQLLAERDQLQAALEIRRVLGSREFAWCLFPRTLAGALGAVLR